MNCTNHPDRERKAFCQNCGKPVCAECARVVGQAVFCEPCLELRLAGSTATGYAPPPSPQGPAAGAGSASYQTRYEAVPDRAAVHGSTGPADGAPYPPRRVPPIGGANPGIAFLLGFVPGVGAMYNGQYAKGVVHLIVFAVLVSLSDQNGIFGIFVAAWVFYQAFEAYHTARARRDGTVLPNPFGLNEVADRFGFGRSWPTTPLSGDFTHPTGAPFEGARREARPSANPAAADPVAWPAAASGSFGYDAAASASGQPGHPAATDWQRTAETYVASAPSLPPVPARSSFPVGAVVLIVLGILFLLGNTRVLAGLPIHILLPLLLIGVGVYVFVRRMTQGGTSLADDGGLSYRIRLVRALQSSIWIVLVGVLFLLDNLNILSWGRSWPLFIILGGVMAFVQRSAYTAAAQQAMYFGYAPDPYSSSPPPANPVSPAFESNGSGAAPNDGKGA